jgi:hypothetical protein
VHAARTAACIDKYNLENNERPGTTLHGNAGILAAAKDPKPSGPLRGHRASPKGQSVAPTDNATQQSSWRIHNPRICHDNIGGGIPIAIFVKPGVKAVAVIHVCGLRELELALRGNLEMVKADSGHLFIGLHLSRWQIAGAHGHNLLVADFGSNSVVAYPINFMPSVLIELLTKQIVTVIVMFVLRKSDPSSH